MKLSPWKHRHALTPLRSDPHALQSSCRRGMLEIVIPQLEATPATKIPVRPG